MSNQTMPITYVETYVPTIGWKQLEHSLNLEQTRSLSYWLTGYGKCSYMYGDPDGNDLVALQLDRGLPSGNPYSIDRYGVCVLSPPAGKEHLGDYGFGWLTSTEVIEAHVTLPMYTGRGIISIADYNDMQEGDAPPGIPDIYLAGDMVVVSTPGTITELTTHVNVEWKIDVSAEFKPFVDSLKKLHYEVGEVRLIFGYVKTRSNHY